MSHKTHSFTVILVFIASILAACQMQPAVNNNLHPAVDTHPKSAAPAFVSHTPGALDNPNLDSPDCRKEEVFCVGMITGTGGLNDKSFNQAAWEGLLRAEKELGASIEVFELDIQDSENSPEAKPRANSRADHPDSQTSPNETSHASLPPGVSEQETPRAESRHSSLPLGSAQFIERGFDVIVTVGYGNTQATRMSARQNPGIRFIGVDQAQDPGSTLQNLTGLIFREDQAGFMAGALAASLSKSGKIAAVLGTDQAPPIVAFKTGYEAGARYINPNIQIVSTYHPAGLGIAFMQPEWGQATARQMIAEGADVIFAAAGNTGNGALLEAASKPGVYCIGVDSDQWETLPEAHPCLVSSAVKQIAPGVFDLIKAAKEGKAFAANTIGQSGLAPFHDFEDKISTELKNRLDEIWLGLMDGSIQAG